MRECPQCKNPELIVIKWDMSMLKVGMYGLATCPNCLQEFTIQIVLKQDR